MKKLNVVTPRQYVIGRSKETAKFYRHEEGIHALINALAVEWHKLTKDIHRIPDTDEAMRKAKYEIFVPQILFDLLNVYQTEIAVEAAKTYLERKGYAVTFIGKEEYDG